MSIFAGKPAMNNNRSCINQFRLTRFFERAQKGDLLTIAFLGGSITQGALATAERYTYAARVYSWFAQTFPNSVFSYINRGVGGTDSLFGNARAAADVLSVWPDMIFVDFSVNDSADDLHRETYEGLLRRLLKAPSSPAVVALGNARYDDGTTAEPVHRPLCDYYGIPYVSVADQILPRILSGEYRWQDLSPDGLHPNDLGHRLLAEAVIQTLKNCVNVREKVITALPWQLTENAFEQVKIIRSANIGRQYVRKEGEGQNRCGDAAVSVPVCFCDGFLPDPLPRTSFRDFFREGWEGRAKGDSICFQLPSSANICIQYRRTIHRPAPIARARLDGEETAVLDGNFDQDWGDELTLVPILVHGEKKPHTLELTIAEASEKDCSSFYLLGIFIA